MSDRNDGGPAFPVSIPPGETQGQKHSGYYEYGMSLRDYFAAMAMMSMQARNAYDEGQATPQQRARLAYIEADAMLAERAK